MWIKKLRRRKSDPAADPLREISPAPRKNPARPAFWAILVVAALMLTTFVVFGAGGGGILRTAQPPAYTEDPPTP